MEHTGKDLKMKKIVIIGYNLFGYLDSLARGFEEHGIKAVLHEHINLWTLKARHPNPMKAFKALLKLKRINKKVIQKIDAEKPDYILVINAEALFPETVACLKKYCPTAVWLVDGYTSLQFTPETIRMFDYHFTFEPSDTRYLPGAKYLTYGADTKHYHPVPAQKLYDVTFTGNGHENRLAVLERIAAVSMGTKWNFSVFGKFQWFLSSRRGRMYRKKYPNLTKCIKLNRIMEPSEINLIYNQSRINLNIHHPHSIIGVNPRTFEIPASGSCLLVDRQPILSDLLIDGQDCLAYGSFDEMIRVIDGSVFDENRLQRIAQSGYQKVIHNHTFGNRCKVLLDTLSHL